MRVVRRTLLPAVLVTSVEDFESYLYAARSPRNVTRRSPLGRVPRPRSGIFQIY